MTTKQDKRSNDGEQDSTELFPGDRAVDREESPERQTPVVIVKRHDATAREIHVEAVGASVYWLNQDYSPDAPVVDVVYESSLGDRVDLDDDLSTQALPELVRQLDLTAYSFPDPRLKRIEDDAGEEIVTDGGTEVGRCRNCGERFDESREELGECPGCGVGLTNPAGFMPEDMDLAAADHHQRIARDMGGGR